VRCDERGTGERTGEQNWRSGERVNGDRKRESRSLERKWIGEVERGSRKMYKIRK
jgi:hypothetical protein